MRFASGGVALSVEIEGPADGVPVVFLHGVASSAQTYAWLPPELTAGRRIMRVDLRGHGRSGHAPGSYLIDRYGQDIADLLQVVAGRPAVLVGHSLGGVVAWWVAQRHPDRVVAAFLEDPPLYRPEPGEHARDRERAIAWQREFVGLSEAAAQLGAEPAGPQGSLRDVAFDDAVRARAAAHLFMDPEVLTAAADGSMLTDTDTTSPVDVPLLILAGEDPFGPAFPSVHEQRLAVTHPGVDVVRVAGAGHLIHEARATRAIYVEQLAAFLDGFAPRVSA